MTFALRVDLESHKGISKGLPKLLDLLKKHNMKASFYVSMGGESNIFEILKHRCNVPGAGERSLKTLNLFEKIRMALYPLDFVKKNLIILKRVIGEGHELGIHGWKHRRWTRGLEAIDISKDVKLAIEKYADIFGRRPDSFCSPAFRTNGRVLDALDTQGIKIISDYFGKKSSKIKGTSLVNVPITIKGEKNTPIIEHMVTRGFSDDEIFDYLVKKISKKNLSSMYIHGMYECIEKIDLLDKLFCHLKKSKIRTKTIRQVADENTSNN